MSEIGGPLDDGGIAGTSDPLDLFRRWMAEARESEPNEANAMVLATADGKGRPDVRMVLLKDADARGFVFYTNTESAKGEQLGVNAQAALCFHWKSLRREVRVRGPVTVVSDEEADAYFASRPKDSQIGAWASAQSRDMSPSAFAGAIAKFTAKYALGPVPRPPFWGGYRVNALEIEFWRDKPFRLHDRLLYSRDGEGAPWKTRRLYP